MTSSFTGHSDNASSSGNWHWGQDLDEFPSADIEPWRFYANASNENNESEPATTRLTPEALRMIDELVIDCKAVGIPMKTKSDFIRVATYKFIEEMARYLDSSREDINAFLLINRQASRVAQESEMVSLSKTNVRKLCNGLQNLVRSDIGEYEEAKRKVREFLQPVLALAGTQDFIMRVYLKELFGSKSFQRTLEILKEKVELGAVISNGERAYIRITTPDGASP